MSSDSALKEMTEKFSQQFEEGTQEQAEQTEQVQQQPQAEQTEDLPDNSSLNTETEASQSQSEEAEQVQQTEQSQSEQREETNDSEQEVEQSSNDDTFTPQEFVEYVSNNIGEDEELRQSLLEQLNITPQSYASEQVEKINQFVKETGRSVEDYFFVNNTLNTESMDAETAVKAQLALDNPDLNTQEITDLFEGKYKLDEDEYSEREVRVSKAMLKADGNKAIRSLNEIKDKYKTSAPKQAEQTQSLVPEGFDKQFNESLTSLESFEFDLGEGSTYTHKLDEGNLSSVKFNVNDPVSRWRNQDGSIDANAMADDYAILANLDNIVKGAVKQATYNTKEADVKSKKNVDLPQQRQPEANKPPQNDFQKDAEMVKNRLLGKR